MSDLKRVEVELDVLLGQTTMPIKQLLRMGRGAIIELDTRERADVLISSAGKTIALGEIAVEDQSMVVRVTEVRPEQVTEVA